MMMKNREKREKKVNLDRDEIERIEKSDWKQKKILLYMHAH